jgi:hypothetical protein
MNLKQLKKPAPPVQNFAPPFPFTTPSFKQPFAEPQPFGQQPFSFTPPPPVATPAAAVFTGSLSIRKKKPPVASHEDAMET